MRRGNPPWLPWADTEARPYNQICLEEIPIFNTLSPLFESPVRVIVLSIVACTQQPTLEGGFWLDFNHN